MPDASTLLGRLRRALSQLALVRPARGRSAGPRPALSRSTLQHLTLSRRTQVLLALFILIIPAVALTALTTRAYRAEQRELAAEAFARGEASLREGRPEQAAGEFRTALSLVRDRRYRLRLAQALAAADRPTEARAHLLTLRERAPGDGVINLELARNAAEAGDVAEAARYYRDAIGGAWEANPEQRRRQARLELAEFLVSAGAAWQGHGELLALLADLPEDAVLHVRVGELLLRAGDPQRAFDLFRSAVRLDGRNADALRGAAESAFQLANYSTARRYLTAAAEVRPDDQAIRERTEVVSAVIGLDPFRRGISSRERARRALGGWRTATARLAACGASLGLPLDATPPADDLQRLAQEVRGFEDQVQVRGLARDSDLLERTMEWIFRIEEITASRCGRPQGADLALLLIGRDRRAAER